MIYTFSPDKAHGAACSADFVFHVDPAFQNRSYHFHNNSFLFDGYSHWFRADSLLPKTAGKSALGKALHYL